MNKSMTIYMYLKKVGGEQKEIMIKSVFLSLSVPLYLFPPTQDQIQSPHVKHLALAT